MKKIILLILVLPILLLAIFAGESLAAKKPSHEAQSASILYPNVDGGEALPYSAPSPIIYEGGRTADCTAIDPDSGVVIIQHDSWGSTWYDFQKNGSMGRMIAVTSAGEREAAYMSAPIPPYPPNPRWITYNCKNALNTWCGTFDVDGGTGINAGYVNSCAMHDGREAIIYHKMGTDELWGTTLAMGDPGQVCSNGNTFANKYDIPDSLYPGNLKAQKGIWPKMGIVYNAVVDTDYMHIVMTEGKTTGGNQRLGYVRCHLLGSGNLLCETPTGQPGVTSPITVAPGSQLIPNKLIGNFGEVPGMSGQYPNTISIVVATSPVSKKAAFVWTSKRVTGDVQVNNDVFKTESDSNGIKWFPQYGGTWPPTIGIGLGKVQNISNYQPTDGERAYSDVAACYDYEDNLHVAWTGSQYDSVAGLAYVYANLYHWSQATGISLVAPGYWGGTAPGGWNRNISKMSISAKDPIYHGSGDSVYLFCTWTQFDSGDVSAGEYSNGDIYAAGSRDSGRTWTPGYNLTGTKTPDCDSSNCLSEHWSSMAQNMYGGDLHIEYVCDKDAGGVIQTPVEGKWTLNPMMYMHVQQLPVPIHCGARFLNQDPPSWVEPPMKIPPAGSRIIGFTLKGIYNLSGNFEVTTDVPGAVVSLNPTGNLSPGQEKPVEITINGAGLAYKSGYVYITTCKATVDQKIITLPVFAVCSNDYQECMRAASTQRVKDNCVCSLWVCSNTQEKWWDKSLPEDSNQIIFSGGAIAAFISGTDTLVGRQDYREMRTAARDTIRTVKDSLWGEPQCKAEKIHVEKTFIWYPPSVPALPVWRWVTINKQIILFHDKPPLTCPEWKKRLVIKYIWVTWGRNPGWWPSPGVYTGHPDIYYGVFADVDAPFDTGCRTMSGESQSGCNAAGWDDANKIVWQRGFSVGVSHPEYLNYYVGMALSNPAGAVVTPLGCKDVRNAQYLYPNNDWGWKDGELYTLAATPLNPATVVDNPDSVVDRSVVMTAGMIPASANPSDTTWVGEFILIEGLSRTGLGDLQTQISDARTILMPELNAAGLFLKTFPICGDVNGDGKVTASDVVYLINYLFVGGPAPTPWPTCRADCNGDGKITTSDVVCLIYYQFVGGPAPHCSGFGD